MKNSANGHGLDERTCLMVERIGLNVSTGLMEPHHGVARRRGFNIDIGRPFESQLVVCCILLLVSIHPKLNQRR